MRRYGLRMIVILLVVSLVVFESSPKVDANPPHSATLIPLDSIQVRAVIGGQGDTTILLIHGYGESLMGWRPTFDALTRSYRVVAFDLPGFGASDKPTGPYTLDRMVQWTRELIAATTQPDQPLIVMGHSMGGEIAASLALTDSAAVDALVLIAPAGFGIGLGGLVDSVTDTKARLIGWYQAARSFVLPIHDPSWLKEPESIADYDLTLDPRYRDATASVLEDFDFSALTNRMASISQPTLLLWGRFDPVIPVTVGRTVVKELPCASLVVFDDALHRPQVEHPSLFLQAIDTFLKSPNCPQSFHSEP